MKAQLSTDESVHPDRARPLISSRAAIPAIAVALAVLIAALILTPVSVWHQPATDAVYRGFDPNLMFISPTGPDPYAGQVSVFSDSLRLVAVGNSRPTVHLLTTPLSFSSSLDAEVVAAPPGSVPLRIELWSAESAAGYVLVFDSAGGGFIHSEIVSGGTVLQDLVGGNIKNTDLGSFVVGQTYHVSIDVDQAKQVIIAHVAGPGVTQSDATITSADSPDLFKAFRYTLAVSSSAQTDPAQAVMRNFSVTVPHQPLATAEQTVKVDDARVHLLVQVLWVAAILLCLGVGVWRAWPWLRRRSRAALLFVAAELKRRSRLVIVLGLVLILYLLANSALFALGSLHYDVFSSKVWSYVAYKYGTPELYYRTVLVPASAAWSGTPLHEAGFPYGITKTYYYLAIGWLYHLWPGASSVPVNDFSFEALLKMLNVVFGFVDGIFAYLIVKRFIRPTDALTSALLFVLNPAVVLVMSVWGSTEAISLFFVLGSILLAETGRPVGAWLMLAGAAFTRPQMFVLAFLLGAVYLRKFGPIRNVTAIAWTVIVAFVVSGPIALAISPSVPVDWIERTLIFHFGNGQADLAYLGTSPGYYSIWTLPLLFVSGQHGIDRMWLPETQPLVGSLTYGQIGAALSVLLLLAVGTVLLLSDRASRQPGRYLPLLAFGMLGWLMVTPGLISRYFVYGIVAIILCRAWFTTSSYFWTVGTLTAITCVGVYGHLGLDFLGYGGPAGFLSPTNNGFSQLVFNLFSADWFITVAALTNIAILAFVGSLAWRSLRPDPHATLQPAPSAT